jgi:hypothetical protein
LPPRLRTFISAERLMAKTVVSAVKPGGQTLEVCPSGFLIWAVALAGAFAAGVRDRAAASCFDCRNGCVLFIDNERLPHSFQSRWHIPFATGRFAQRREGRVWQSLVPSHSAVQLHRRATARSPNPVKIASLCFGERRDRYCQSRPAGRTPRVSLSIHMVSCFHFFPAAKCPTHLK